MHALLKNVCLIASVVSMLFLFMGIKLPDGVLLDTIDLCGSATTPVAMILVGIMLGEYRILELLAQWKLTAVSVFKVLINPILAAALLVFLPVPEVVKIGTIFAFSFPCAVMSAPMAMDTTGDTKIGVSLVAITHILAVITVPFTAYLLTTFFGL